MFFKKATLFVVLLATALNISGMKRQGSEIPQKTSSKRIKLTTPDTDLNKILQLGQRSTQPKETQKNKIPAESIKIFIDPTKDQINAFYNAIEEKDLAAVEKSLSIGINP